MRHIQIEKPFMRGKYVLSFTDIRVPAISSYIKPLTANSGISRLLGHKKKYMQLWPQGYIFSIDPGVIYEWCSV